MSNEKRGLLDGPAPEGPSTPSRKWYRSIWPALIVQNIIIVWAMTYNMQRWHWGFWANGGPFFPPFELYPPGPYDHLAVHCRDIAPIQASEFIARQTALARVLNSTGSAAYIAEPGSNSLYFANVSRSYWSLSERPFLVVITPHTGSSSSSSASNTISANITILTPRFELARAKLLSFPASSPDALNYVDWAEDQDPFQVLKEHLKKHIGSGEVVVDDGTRKLIADGLSGAGLRLKFSYPKEVARLREQKSEAEIDLLRCANEVY